MTMAPRNRRKKKRAKIKNAIKRMTYFMMNKAATSHEQLRHETQIACKSEFRETMRYHTYF